MVAPYQPISVTSGMKARTRRMYKTLAPPPVWITSGENNRQQKSTINRTSKTGVRKSFLTTCLMNRDM